MRLCAQAVADYLNETGLARQGLVIGYDTRFASEDFAAAAAEVAAGNGIKAYLCPKAAPTPTVSFGVVTERAGGAVIITASHNPSSWNGFKFKTPDGASAPPEVIARIEANIARREATGKILSLPLATAIAEKRVVYLDGLAAAYEGRLRELVDLGAIKNSRLRIVIDPMFGAGMGYFRRLIGGATPELIEINSERNPIFPGMKQPEPIGPNLTRLSETVKREKADVGIATDGDADRLGVIDEHGNHLSTLSVFTLLCLYLLEVKGERGALVKTVTMSRMIDRLGELFKVPVFETQVGFKYVAPVMLRENALAGGEESGGYSFRGHIPERDGILAGLYFLDLMVRTGKSPFHLVGYLESKVGPHYYNRRDFHFPPQQRQAIVDRLQKTKPDIIAGSRVARFDTLDGFRFTLQDNSWLLVRFSGTEPLLRIYAETDSPDRVEKILDFGQELTGVG